MLTPGDFIRESNLIEGIDRVPADEEIFAFGEFMMVRVMTVHHLSKLQAVFAPAEPLRIETGMDVCVGKRRCPPGGPQIAIKLTDILLQAGGTPKPWFVHALFEYLHPYMDGNGRTGRALWAWHMMRLDLQPFALPFLQRYYYQTLEFCDGRLDTMALRQRADRQ